MLTTAQGGAVHTITAANIISETWIHRENGPSEIFRTKCPKHMLETDVFSHSVEAQTLHKSIQLTSSILLFQFISLLEFSLFIFSVLGWINMGSYAPPTSEKNKKGKPITLCYSTCSLEGCAPKVHTQHTASLQCDCKRDHQSLRTNSGSAEADAVARYLSVPDRLLGSRT